MPEHSSLESIVAAYGAAAKGKLGSIAVHGEPEDQLRSPLETLIADVAEFNGLLRAKLALVGESLLGELKTRSDFAVTYGNVLIGYIEVKAPGKGRTRGGSESGTTRSSGRSSRRYRTSSTPTATTSRCGATASSWG